MREIQNERIYKIKVGGVILIRFICNMIFGKWEEFHRKPYIDKTIVYYVNVRTCEIHKCIYKSAEDYIDFLGNHVTVNSEFTTTISSIIKIRGVS